MVNNNQDLIHLRPIETIQLYLRQLSEYYPEIPQIIPDGVYGPETTAAVKAFQEIFGLPVTGEMDIYTWDLLLFVHNELNKQTAPSEQVQFFPQNIQDQANCQNCFLEPCDYGNLILILQIMLKEIGKTFSDFNQVELTGYYDLNTTEAVLTFQARNGLEQTGIVNNQTWNRMVRFFNQHNQSDISNTTA